MVITIFNSNIKGIGQSFVSPLINLSNRIVSSFTQVPQVQVPSLLRREYVSLVGSIKRPPCQQKELKSKVYGLWPTYIIEGGYFNEEGRYLYPEVVWSTWYRCSNGHVVQERM